MKKILLSAAFVWASFAAQAQCEAVATINENFSEFTTGPFPNNCWTASHQAPMTSIDADNEAGTEKSITIYSFFSPNTPIYVVSPEISTIDGNHKLSFSANIQAGSNEGAAATLQTGTLSNPTDFTTFVPFGDAIALTAEPVTYDEIVFPASTTHKYIAFQIVTNVAHVASTIDNIVWEAAEEPVPTCEAVASLDEDFSDFTLSTSAAFPQNCWSAIAGSFPAGPVVYTAQAGDPSNQYATFYASTSINTNAYLVTPEISTLDGEHALSFSAWKLPGQGGIPAGNVTIQPGTITDPADATTFVAFGDAVTVTTGTSETFDGIVIPASETNKHIAFRISADTAHNAIAIDNIVWEAYEAPCAAVATIDEDFADFALSTSAAFPQNCWSAIAGSFPAGPVVYTAQAGEPSNQYATFYASTSVNTPAYLVAPEVSTLDGNHQLSFSTWKTPGQGGIPAGTVTIQPGTITDAADATTFVAFGDAITVTTGTPETHDGIILPASETNKHIAFRISADTAHNAVAIDNVVWSEVPAAVCESVTEIDEDFTTFDTSDEGEFPQNCWSAIAEGPMVYPAITASNAHAQFYSFFSAATAAYLIAPEVSNIDGNHTLTFDAASGSAITVQPGYFTNATDATTFTAVGSVITLTPAPATTYNVNFPAVTGAAHPAFQITAPGMHQSATIDNVKWQTTAGIGSNNKSIFAVYPNPSSDKNITIANSTHQDGSVAIFSLTGAKVFEAKVSGASVQINLSSLSTGMYVVRFTTGTAVATQKLIIQ